MRPAVARRLAQRARPARHGARAEPAQRAGWLQSLPPGDAHLSPLLEELLRSHAEGAADGFLQQPATDALALRPPAGPADEPAGGAPDATETQAVVGPYRLLRQIGAGGMASVWLADRSDGLLDRRVALKLPHPVWGVATFADRMSRERNILASLTHPSIARLYDAGIAADGRPYLALEYVDGAPIDAYAERTRPRRAGARRRSSSKWRGRSRTRTRGWSCTAT